MRRPALEVEISKIVIGKRHRQVMGDIAELAASIAEVGLLHPVVVTPEHRLVAGERRIRAYQQLDRCTIPATVVDLKKIARGEHAENTCRKDFTPTEAVAIKRALEPIERVAAKERQRVGGRAGGKGSGKLPEASKGEAADKAAKATSMSRRTLEKAEAVVDAAAADPKKYGKLYRGTPRPAARRLCATDHWRCPWLLCQKSEGDLTRQNVLWIRRLGLNLVRIRSLA